MDGKLSKSTHRLYLLSRFLGGRGLVCVINNGVFLICFHSHVKEKIQIQNTLSPSFYK